MKNTIKTALVLAVTTQLAYSVQYSLSSSNASDVASDTILLDNAGVPIVEGTGFAGIGSFAVDPSTLSSDAIAGAFNVLASDTVDSSAIFGAPGIDGFFTISGDVDSADANAMAAAGGNVYLVLADSNSLASASSIGVVQVNGATFESAFAGPGPFALAAAFSSTANTAVLGSFGPAFTINDATNPANGATTTGSFGLVAVVPEPSSALLAGLALVGGLARRRR